MQGGAAAGWRVLEFFQELFLPANVHSYSTLVPIWAPKDGNMYNASLPLEDIPMHRPVVGARERTQTSRERERPKTEFLPFPLSEAWRGAA